MGLRSFIAVELPRELRKNIDLSISGLRSTGADVKWVAAKNMHITLKFLGLIPEDMVLLIKTGLSNELSSKKQFSIRIQGAGVFPNSRHPNIIWVGMAYSDELKDLFSRVEKTMEGFGFKREQRAFSPHLTVGRFRLQARKDTLLKELDMLKDKVFGDITIDRVSLIKSELRPAGPEYAVLCDIPFGGGCE